MPERTTTAGRVDTGNVRRLTLHCRRCRHEIGEVVGEGAFRTRLTVHSYGNGTVIECPCGYRNRWFRQGLGLTDPDQR